jgi:hypothetical protein
VLKTEWVSSCVTAASAAPVDVVEAALSEEEEREGDEASAAEHHISD